MSRILIEIGTDQRSPQHEGGNRSAHGRATSQLLRGRCTFPSAPREHRAPCRPARRRGSGDSRPTLKVEDLADRAKVEAAIETLEEYVLAKRPGDFVASIEQDEEHDRQRVIVETQDDGDPPDHHDRFRFPLGGQPLELRQIYAGVRATREAAVRADRSRQGRQAELGARRGRRPRGALGLCRRAAPARASASSATRASAR